MSSEKGGGECDESDETGFPARNVCEHMGLSGGSIQVQNLREVGGEKGARRVSFVPRSVSFLSLFFALYYQTLRLELRDAKLRHFAFLSRLAIILFQGTRLLSNIITSATRRDPFDSCLTRITASSGRLM